MTIGVRRSDGARRLVFIFACPFVPKPWAKACSQRLEPGSVRSEYCRLSPVFRDEMHAHMDFGRVGLTPSHVTRENRVPKESTNSGSESAAIVYEPKPANEMSRPITNLEEGVAS